MYEKLERLMKERGITPYVVASYTGISQGTISGWKKKGMKNPQYETLRKLAEYFDVPLSYFLEE